MNTVSDKKTFIGLTIRAEMIGRGHPILCENLVDNQFLALQDTRIHHSYTIFFDFIYSNTVTCLVTNLWRYLGLFASKLANRPK